MQIVLQSLASSEYPKSENTTGRNRGRRQPEHPGLGDSLAEEAIRP